MRTPSPTRILVTAFAAAAIAAPIAQAGPPHVPSQYLQGLGDGKQIVAYPPGVTVPGGVGTGSETSWSYPANFTYPGVLPPVAYPPGATVPGGVGTGSETSWSYPANFTYPGVLAPVAYPPGVTFPGSANEAKPLNTFGDGLVHRPLPSERPVAAQVVERTDGFDLRDAGIGAGIASAIALLLAGGAMATRRHRRLAHSL